GVDRLDFTRLSQLDFHAPDFKRFPCLRIAMDAIEHGGTVPAAINAANEEAVAAFLASRIGFLDIPKVVMTVAQGWSQGEPSGLADVISADHEARALAQCYIATLN
ncbi:MAG TPA: 1-deoxy-D-xylulose-5-phosphate reductoisomerase, partial [Marinagarivorans sp.]